MLSFVLHSKNLYHASSASMSRTFRIITSLLYLVLIFHLVDSKCVTTFCGNKTLPIHYPFTSQGRHQKGCNDPAIDLTCSNQTSPVLNLPSFGDFHVRSINYTTKTIQLYDPSNCLGGRFLNSNFPTSPIVGINYQNYTFFTCPGGFNTNGANFTAISCLSNSSISVLATTSILRAQELSKLGCNMSVTVPVPVSSSLQFEYNGFGDDLFLTWNVMNCDVCTKKKGVSAGRVVGLIILSLVWPYLSVFAFYILILALIKLVKWLISFIKWVNRMIKGICSRLKRLFSPRTQNSAVQLYVVNPEGMTRLPRNPAAPQNSNNVNSATRTVVLGESRRIPEPNGTVCPICLEDFKAKETLRILNGCRHGFHSGCIDQWLTTHHSCPTCRNTTP